MSRKAAPPTGSLPGAVTRNRPHDGRHDRPQAMPRLEPRVIVAAAAPAKAVGRRPRGKVATVRKSAAAIDDPVRLYLLQMGGIPLLTRDSEVSSAREIEHWRRKFRNTMLANDLILAGAVQLLVGDTRSFLGRDSALAGGGGRALHPCG